MIFKNDKFRFPTCIRIYPPASIHPLPNILSSACSGDLKSSRHPDFENSSFIISSGSCSRHSLIHHYEALSKFAFRQGGEGLASLMVRLNAVSSPRRPRITSYYYYLPTYVRTYTLILLTASSPPLRLLKCGSRFVSGPRCLII